MDRSVIYTAEQGRSVDFLFAQRAIMIAIGKLAQAALGSNTVVRGLAVTPNSPAALNVLVGIGEIYTVAAVDATTYGSLAADSDQIVQQGLNMAAQTISTPAPSTSGYSIAYLIEAQFQSQDTTTAVLPFFNSANPSIPLNGQGGGGATLPTERQGVCVIQAKAGVAATTGAQVTPTVDSGWTALAVVTVANGATTVIAGNITIPAGVPQISSLVQMMQTGSSVYAVDTSASANAIALSLTPAVTAYTDGEPIRFKAANSNTGPCTINWGGGSIALNGANGAFQGGEIIAGKQYEASYNSTTGTAILLGQTAGALQIPPATASQHAAQLGQMQTAVGAVGFQSIAATVASNALTATLTAPGAMLFRNPTLTSGAPVSASIASNLSLTVPSTATLGVIAATQTRLVWLIAYNGGTPVLCVANITGGLNLDETTLISPTTISTGSTSSNVIYSASAVSANSPFRVVGFCDITEATPGTWATGPTTVQGIGGQALAALSSIGYGQTWQNPSRTLATTYYNTTGKPIQVVVTASSTNTNSGILLTINGSIGVVGSSSSAANTINSVTAIVPPGDSYAVTIPAGGASLNTWSELR